MVLSGQDNLYMNIKILEILSLYASCCMYYLLNQNSDRLTSRTVRNAGDLMETAELQLLKSHKDIALKPWK